MKITLTMFSDFTDINLLSLMIGIGIGILGGMLGLAGGFLMVPYLTLLALFPMQQAVGTSLFAGIFTAISATVNYSRQGRVDFKLGLILSSIAAPSAMFGAYLTSYLSSQILRIIFGFIVGFLSLNMIIRANSHPQKNLKLTRRFKLWNRNFIDSQGEKFNYSIDIPLALVCGFIIGVTSGLLGLGGGVIGIPLLTMIVGIPIHISIATSAFMVIIISGLGSLEHMLLKNIIFPVVFYLGAGVMTGAIIGTKITRRVPAKNMKIIFGFVLLLIAIRMIIII